jgi:AcrR family transcriptional regulator
MVDYCAADNRSAVLYMSTVLFIRYTTYEYCTVTIIIANSAMLAAGKLSRERGKRVPPKTTKPMTKPASRGRSGKGQHTALAIILAAEKLLVDEGYHNFSLRKVAASAGLTLGNLQYYFPSKDSLIKAMLDNCIQRYLDMFERLRLEAGSDPEEQFVAVISEIFRDLNSKYTTVFFPEVWSLANHDDHATEFMDAMYEKYRLVLVEIIALLNPELSPDQQRRLAIFISSSMEGHTMFIGHKKVWTKETENIIAMAIQSFLWLIHSATIPE